MKLSVIIVAGGKGLRMGAELPKQFLSLSSRPILMHTIERFHASLPDAQIILALGGDYFRLWESLCRDYNFHLPINIVQGGDSRFESVKNSLGSVAVDTDYVLITDGVRPFVSEELIARVVDGVVRYGAVVPAVDVTDSLRREMSTGGSQIIDRKGVKSVQTPQAFRRDIILTAYRSEYKEMFTDDATVVESAGYEVTLVEGDRLNIKITTPEDIKFGNFLLNIAEN